MNCFNLIADPADFVQESDLILAQTVQQWADKEVIAKRLEYGEDYEQLLKPAMDKLFIELELQKLLWPEDCGGLGYNLPEAAITIVAALEQVGRADTGIGYLAAVNFALSSMICSGRLKHEGLCNSIAPLFCQADETTLCALILPAYSPKAVLSEQKLFRGKYYGASAQKNGQSLVISGEKLRPLNSGSDAQIVALICSLEGSEEPAMVLVPGDNHGLSRGERLLKTGLAASLNAEINLSRVSIPVSNIIFQGEGSFQQLLTRLYLNMSAVTVGSLFAVFEIIRTWGDTRVIKGKGNLFKENPLTASVMAEISHEILLSRLLLYQLAQLIASSEPEIQSRQEELYISALSVVSHITMSAEKAINQTMELMGSAGYATEWNLERYWRDVKTLQVHLGSWDLNKLALARFFYRSRNL